MIPYVSEGEYRQKVCLLCGNPSIGVPITVQGVGDFCSLRCANIYGEQKKAEENGSKPSRKR